MEPNLIRKFNSYMRYKAKNKIVLDIKMNDSGVTFEDMRSNDIWSILFLLLLTHNPKFSFCYTYREQNKDGDIIKFDSSLFKKLFERVLRKYENDLNFCFVIKEMIGFHRFKEISVNRRIQPNKELLYFPNSQSRRDLKFYIWILTYKKFPKNRIRKFKEHSKLRELDECKTLGSNISLYDQESEDEEIKLNMSLKKAKNVSTWMNSSTYVGLEVFPAPNYGFFKYKSSFKIFIPSKKEIVIKNPVQNFMNVPIFSYKKPQKSRQSMKSFSEIKISYKLNSGKSVDPLRTKIMKRVRIKQTLDNIIKVPTPFEILEFPVDHPCKPSLKLPMNWVLKERQPRRRPSPQITILKTRDSFENSESSYSPKHVNLKQKSRKYNSKINLDGRSNNNLLETYKQNKMNINKMQFSNLDEIDGQDELLFKLPRRSLNKNLINKIPEQCECRICMRTTSNVRSIKRKGHSRFEKLPIKSFEQKQQDKFQSRIKKIHKPRFPSVQLEDPYKNHKKRLRTYTSESKIVSTRTSIKSKARSANKESSDYTNSHKLNKYEFNSNNSG